MRIVAVLLYGLGGARFLRVKVPNPPGSGKDIVEGKGVHREVESEGSRMWEQTNYGQISGLTNRSAKDAILKVKEYAEQGYTYVLVLDLSKS